MRVRLTVHAQAALRERGLERAWAERAAAAPEWTEPDPTQPGAVRAFLAIPEREGRVLGVVYVDEGSERRILTAFFDRTRRSGPRQRR